ncbi:MAG: exodeoxyribonuclease V subunit gamma [Desulfofustis sp.]
MFYLYNSNRTERLAEQLAAVVSATKSQNPFEQTAFLVQNREIKRLLNQYLADRFGVWGNSTYLLPLSFIAHVCETLEIPYDSASFDRSVMVWRLERLLRDLSDPAMTPIRSYLSGDHPDIKRYQLARQIADLFDQYQIMRPAMIDSWDRDRTVTDKRAEQWQQHLWKRLRQEGDGRNRAEVIGTLIRHLEGRQEELPGGLKKLFVFGLHTLPPLFLSILDNLARLSDIHFFLLTPCAEYWGDMESARQRLSRDKEIDLAADLTAYHPLLAGLGRQGADFQELLLSRVEEIYDGPQLFVVNAEQNRDNLLHRLQDDLLTARYEAAVTPPSIAPGDDSIVVVSCHSRMRETAVLKDYIITWLNDDPRLGLHDIVVMAPDIQEYRDFIAAAFSDMTFDISDCRKRRDNRHVEIFSRFLKLFTGRYEAADLLGLLDQPEVRRTFSISTPELEQITQWVRDAGIRWGLSEEQRGDDGYGGFEAGTWLNGLERLMLGLASGSKACIDNRVPYVDIEAGEADLLGNLCLFIELIEQSRSRIRHPRSLTQWSMLFDDMISGLFGDDDTAEILQLQEICSSLAGLYARYHEEPLSFDAVRQWFEHEADGVSSAGFLRGRLSFCSMLPMRSIPFKIICLLGLNDKEFPRQDRIIPFDLLSGTYEKGDRSRRADDRYQFLEAVLAARQRLYISYIGQSIRSNEPIPPSPVIAELLEVAKHCYGPVEVVDQPLQPFNEAYFTDASGLFSHSEYYCRTARSLRTNPQPDRGPWLDKALPRPGVTNLDLHDLERFIGNPQRYFVQNMLEIKLQTKDERRPGDEPFGLEGLEKYLLNQIIMEHLIAGHHPDTLFLELQQEQLWPLGFPGRNQFDTVADEIGAFILRIHELEPALSLESIDIELALGSLRVVGVIEHYGRSGLLFYRYSPMKGRDLLRGWLLHLLAGAAGVRRGATRIVAQDEIITIGAAVGTEEDLQRLIELYLRGCEYPSPCYVEPAYAYGRQVLKNRGRGKKDPLTAAIERCSRSIERGYSPELNTLYREPEAAALLDAQFQQAAEQIMVPILEQAEIVSLD